MSCCGRQRQAVSGESAALVEDSVPVWISYAGAGAIAVKGAATGHVYRFAPGNWLRVNGSDALSMQAIPGLRLRTLDEPA